MSFNQWLENTQHLNVAGSGSKHHTCASRGGKNHGTWARSTTLLSEVPHHVVVQRALQFTTTTNKNEQVLPGMDPLGLFEE